MKKIFQSALVCTMFCACAFSVSANTINVSQHINEIITVVDNNRVTEVYINYTDPVTRTRSCGKMSISDYKRYIAMLQKREYSKIILVVVKTSNGNILKLK